MVTAVRAHDRDDVSDDVDGHVEAEVAHPSNHQIATVSIGVGQGQTGAAPLASAPGDRTDLGEILQTSEETAPIDVDTHGRRLEVA